MENVFTLNTPENPLPIIYDSPHSGTTYPRDFRYTCSFAELERAEDKFVDDLFADAPAYGGTLLAAQFPRSYIDVNRAVDDIDPILLKEDWPGPINPTPRAQAGIGLVRRLVKPGVALYERRLEVEDIKHRIDTYYWPYHKALAQEIDRAYEAFGQVWHINCHSMPSQNTFSKSLRRVSIKKPDFVLGDRDGTTCDPDFVDSVKSFLIGLGYRVTVNDPYKGVECVRRYARPEGGRNSLQIEICKSLYMNEDLCQKTDDFEPLKEDLNLLMGFIADYARAHLLPLAAD